MSQSAYIHIPFCKRKCNYCTFVSYPKLDLKEKYLNALGEEIDFFYNGETLDTIYFGGGTPSLLSVDDIENILNMLKINPSPLTPTDKSVPSSVRLLCRRRLICLPQRARGKKSEITLEINPETVDEEYFEDLRKIGVNRLSIGVQDFDDDILKLIGRGHNSSQAVEVVKSAQNVGFDNISIDLIYGLPNQTLQSFETSLNKAFELNIQHISLYGLKIEKDCYFYKNKPQNLPDDDMQAEFYLKAVELCEKNGFEHYEISNFSLKGFESKHNLNYWNNKNYYGFGCAASGYEDNIRYYNEIDLEKYIKNPIKKFHEDVLTSKQQMEEEIFLGFRKAEGINVSQINERYGVDFEKMFFKPLKKYSEKYILKTEKGYRFSNDGFLVSNIILSEFI